MNDSRKYSGVARPALAALSSSIALVPGLTLVAGRCISADHVAHARSRNMPACMATGQAAGVAAAIAIEEGATVRNVAVKKSAGRVT